MYNIYNTINRHRNMFNIKQNLTKFKEYTLRKKEKKEEGLMDTTKEVITTEHKAGLKPLQGVVGNKMFTWHSNHGEITDCVL